MRQRFASGPLLAIIAVSVAAAWPAAAAESKLAIINAGISSAEDAPFVASNYRFAPGDYLYVTFEIAGFAVHEENRGETRKISLSWAVTPQDETGRALAEASQDTIQTTLTPEDKNWVPKRRASFLLPSFLAAGRFRVRIDAKDEFGKENTSRDLAFEVGGEHLQPANAITIENFHFLRNENDTEALSVPAYSAGDTVFARFDLTGFQNGPGNRHHVTYGVTVLGPDGKAFIQDSHAADLDDSGFYPAQFVPGNVALKMGKNNPRGQYIVVVRVRDLLAKSENELKEPFSIE